MNKNRANTRSRLQILTEPLEESRQLDLLSFVSDYALADLSTLDKQVRTTITKNNIAKSPLNPTQGNFDKNKTFSNFCIGNSNHFALEAVKRFIDDEKSDFNMIYLLAPSGLGKSHILHAVANELLNRKKTFHLSSPFLLSLLIENFHALKFYQFILVDDIEEIERNNEFQKLFCQLIDYAQTGRIKLLITGTKRPKDLENTNDRLKGKLSASLIHTIYEMNSSLAKDIVNSKCQTLNLKLPESVKDLVSTQFDFNVYGLESLLNKFKSTKDMKNEEITLKIAMKEVKVSKIPNHQDDFRGFLKTVALHFNINLQDLVSSGRKKEFAFPRHLAMYILKEKNGLSLMRIAQIFEKDHSTVIYAVSRIKKQLESDLLLKQNVQNLLEYQS